ncbi:unnamed protein product [Gongylonema pulchrum]|uniref:SAC domain-containing protein n=1 Tax=Gongylonema pulchrum TaxID=637853 RepID=A0A183EC77_9BILA|nr:unnamed protein product [Gongylonema pulchrum]
MPAARLQIDGVDLGEVDSYVYFGQLNMRHNFPLAAASGRAASWHRFYSIIDILNVLNRNDRAHLFNTAVLKEVTYGCEMCSVKKAEEQALAVMERAMERGMLNVSFYNRINNQTLRQMNSMQDIITSKIRWAGHAALLTDNRWTMREKV